MKICIIGSSGHYGYALNGIRADGQSDIAGLSKGDKDENIEGLIKQVREAGYQPEVYDDPVEMIDELKPDIAVINTFFHKNSKLAIEAMKRGINVYIEKPVALTLEELDRLIEVYNQTQVKLSTMLGIRYSPHFWTAHNLVKNNKIGKIRLIHAQKSYKLGVRPEFYKRRETYGGTIPWVGIHAIDWIYWFSEKKFKNVYASHSSLFNNNNGELEVTAVCNFTLEDEVLATVNIDYLRHSSAPTHGDDRVRIVGTEGVVEVINEKVFLLGQDTDGQKEVPPEQGPVTFLDFIWEVRGIGKCLVSAEDSFYVTKASLLARESADRNEIISF
ncbi:MAG TPA: Gfo/Idh/MocA family oxidoreductase [bacterium]|nr:Gfo/Idh/MocA family oxidoreductase [Dictyoglomota bacterium]HOP55524.1 Gfo/Idh/MocA family oxidoreductase [bacterium]